MWQYLFVFFLGLLPQTAGSRKSMGVLATNWTNVSLQQDRKPGMRAFIAEAPTSVKAAELVNKALPDAEKRTVNRLVQADRSLALFAVWQDLKRGSSKSATTDEVARFVGRCEAILGIEAPQTWIDSLYNSGEDRRSFSALASITYHDLGCGLRARQSTITYNDKKLRLQMKVDEDLLIPIAKLKPPPCESIDFTGVDNEVYIAFPSQGSAAYKLVKYASKDGKILWTAEVWSSDLAASSGGNHHYVDLVMAKGEVVVFGSDSYSAYIESFSLENGTPLIRFNTRRWSK